MYGLLLGTYESFRADGWSLPLASVISTLPESIVRGPLEAIKNMQQTLRKPSGTELAMVLLKGTVGTWVRETPGNLVYFSSFDYFRKYTDVSTLTAGAATGALLAAAVYPIEAMRTQYVTGIRPIRPTFRGGLPYMGRSITMVAGTMVAYKLISGRDMGQPPPTDNTEAD